MTTLHPSLRHAVLAAFAALAALSLALFGPSAQSPARAASASDAEKSVVYLYVQFDGEVKVPYNSGTETYTSSIPAGCTGWFASSQAHIVTAAHCVEKSDDIKLAILKNVMQQLGISEYLQRAWDENWATVTNVTVRAYQPQGVEGAVPALQNTGLTAQLIDAQTFANGDLALLKIADLSGTTPLTMAQKSPGTGERVTAVGFAGSVTDVSDASRQRASFKTGTVSSRQVTTTGVPVTEIDAAVTNGMSGGPTIDNDGNAIGVNSFKPRGESQAFNFVTDTEALKTFLTRNGVTPVVQTPPASAAPSTASTTAPASSGDSLPLYLTIGGAAIVVLGLGATLFIVMGKRRRASGPSAQTAVAGPAGQFPGGQAPQYAAGPAQPGTQQFAGTQQQGPRQYGAPQYSEAQYSEQQYGAPQHPEQQPATPATTVPTGFQPSQGQHPQAQQYQAQYQPNQYPQPQYQYPEVQQPGPYQAGQDQRPQAPTA
ncbi:trypsin-like peptidase domain-containing protein [Sinomonas flava]|uniref:S1 family peptidase n=1 Tax=Sinomonas flava TaxID=496857 RepID=UPI0039A4B4DE